MSGPIGWIARRWWDRREPLSPTSGRINIAIGVACGVCVLLDVRLGLESLGRWYLGYFAVVLIGWGLLVLRLGKTEAAQPLRLAGDVLGWAGLIGFAAVGLLLDPPEYPALITLVAFAVGVVLMLGMSAIVRRRSGTA